MCTASAAGLGAGDGAAVLGQPLDFAVQVRLDAGETLTSECVFAEVTAGDRRIPPAQVRALVEMTGPETARVRVQTQPSMDEPVIAVQLAVGCTSRISRRYVVLADPPGSMAGAVPALAANPVPVPEEPPAAAPAGAPQRPVPAPQQSVAAGFGGDATTSPSAGSAPNAARTRQALDPAAVERQAQRRAERRAAREAASRERAMAAANAAAGTAAAPAARPARLKLDFVEPTPASANQAAVEDALAAVAQAASAARAAASAASASAERIGVLERTVEQLRADAKSSKDLAAQFRRQLAEAEGGSFWLGPLVALSVLLAALAAWLAWRLGRLNTDRQQGWKEAVVRPPAAAAEGPVTLAVPSRQPAAPPPFVTSANNPPAPVAIRAARAAPAWPPPAPPVSWPPPASTLPPEETIQPEPATQRTEPMPQLSLREGGAARDVSIEELIDLEQQAEFFVVLGQDEAAIDLLVEHLRSTGGGSPLPYLKLLEIHRRRDERDAYERIRNRFNHRFNAYAPEWGVDLGHGRSLDDYAGVIPRLQQIWPQPLDAMAELEALLFRKSRGELFDLPAYREVLFLYSLARDLLDRGAADVGDVDLLLPMSDGSSFGTTSPSPFQALERNAFRDTEIPEDRPTRPVDLDVTSISRPTSIFDVLDDTVPPTTKLDRPRQP
jgi:pilus assembly protein FimV